MSVATDQDNRVLPLSNVQIAGRLDEVAGLLEAQGANPFRVRAYQFSHLD